MIAVDMVEGKLFHDTEIKDKLAAAQPFGEWVGKITDLDEALSGVTETPLFEGASCASARSRRAIPSRSWSRSSRRWPRTARKSLASMGDDTPSAVLSKQVPPAQPFLPAELQPGDEPAHRQLARIPGDEPQDAVRQPQERAGRGQQPDRDPVLDSPFVGNAQFDEMVERISARVVEIDCTFPPGAGPGALREGLERIRSEAEDAVRSGAGI
jgi:glutamate synthase (NADPH/NADH) large chain